MPSSTGDSAFYRFKEVANLLNVTEKTLRDNIRRKSITPPFIAMGSKHKRVLLFPKTAFNRWAGIGEMKGPILRCTAGAWRRANCQERFFVQQSQSPSPTPTGACSIKARKKRKQPTLPCTRPPTRRSISIRSDRIELIDDFEQRVSLSRAANYGVMLENFDKAKLAAVEFGMHNARTQAAFQTRAQADPSLRTQRGPAVLTPMGPNGGFNA